MSLNCKEIDAIIHELDLNGSFIQQIVQPAFDSIAFYTYKAGCAKTVFVCLAAGACRIHQTNQKIPKTEKPLRFMEFLRSRIKGCRIENCVQVGQERIIRFDLLCSDADDQKQLLHLYIRLWSGAANIFLTDAQQCILDAFYRRPKRKEMSGEIFSIPEEKKSGEQNDWQIRRFTDVSNSTADFDENPSFNQLIDLWYAKNAHVLSRTALLEQAEKIFNARKSRIQAALHRLEEKRADFLVADRWRHYGDLLLAYGNLVSEASENHCSFIECQDYESDMQLRIDINPKKNLQENANLYYTKYKKAVSGLSDLESDIGILRSDLAKLASEYECLQKEENPLEIQKRLHTQTMPKQQVEKHYPGLRYVIDGWIIYVGRSAAENDELLRHHVKGQDWWLHTRDWQGGYVFIKNKGGKSIPLDILLDAGNLALFYSKGRKAGSADLYYTQVKHLRRAKNAPKGTVLPTNEKNLSIKIDSERLKRIEMITKEILL